MAHETLDGGDLFPAGMGAPGRRGDECCFAAIAGGHVLSRIAAGQIELKTPLGWLVALQGHVVGWFAGFTHGSYRILGPAAADRDYFGRGAESVWHPSAEVLERLRGSGVRILRTDEEGAVGW